MTEKILNPENNIVILCRPEKHTVVDISDSNITIRGSVSGTKYQRTFKIGDLVEYDSDYNGSLFGKLKRIYKNAVLITSNQRIYRVSLFDFARRNWDLKSEEL